MDTHELPTHLAVEDKILAGLTPRQILLLGLGVALAFSLWHRLLAWHVPQGLCFAAAFVLFCGAFVVAHVRPDGRNLESWLLAYLRYRSVAKIYVLGRTTAVDAEPFDEVSGMPDGARVANELAAIAPDAPSRRSVEYIEDDEDDEIPRSVPTLAPTLPVSLVGMVGTAGHDWMHGYDG